MSYGDDQCKVCGGIRVAKSTLCVDCLVKLASSFGPAQDIAEAKIKELKEKNKELMELCKRLLDHIAQEIIYKSNLDEEIRKYWNKV